MPTPEFPNPQGIPVTHHHSEQATYQPMGPYTPYDYGQLPMPFSHQQQSWHFHLEQPAQQGDTMHQEDDPATRRRKEEERHTQWRNQYRARSQYEYELWSIEEHTHSTQRPPVGSHDGSNFFPQYHQQAYEEAMHTRANMKANNSMLKKQRHLVEKEAQLKMEMKIEQKKRQQQNDLELLINNEDKVELTPDQDDFLRYRLIRDIDNKNSDRFTFRLRIWLKGKLENDKEKLTIPCYSWYHRQPDDEWLLEEHEKLLKKQHIQSSNE